jgi:L-threonylcarbamoyladenylate synthase
MLHPVHDPVPFHGREEAFSNAHDAGLARPGPVPHHSPMKRIQVDPVHPDPEAIARAAAIIRAGGLVAFPTETVYGLGANALDPEAVLRVFQAKGRPSFNPLIAHVADSDGAARLVRAWPEIAGRLAAAFWPGPLTLVLPRASIVPDAVTGGLPEVAVRVPAHPVALALLRVAAVPIVAPSANPSNAVSPTSADHVEKHLGERLDLILDGGPTRLGIESTVVDLSGARPRILRPGALPADRIEALVGPLAELPATDSPRRHASPGMLDRHYAPKANLLVFDGHQRAAAAATARQAVRQGMTVGALHLGGLDAEVQHETRMPDQAREYARILYAELHRLDDLGCDLILAEQVPEGREWEGVRDRLTRGATPPTPEG